MSAIMGRIVYFDGVTPPIWQVLVWRAGAVVIVLALLNLLVWRSNFVKRFEADLMNDNKEVK